MQLCPPRSTIRHLAGSASRRLAASPLHPAARLRPSHHLGKCFFFISLVVRLPYSLIFCRFWFFVFKLLLSFFWLCEEAQNVYLRLHLGQKSHCVLFAVLNLCIFWEDSTRPQGLRVTLTFSFSQQAGTQSTEPRQPGPLFLFYIYFYCTFPIFRYA